MPAVCVWAPSCSSKSKRTVDVLPELQHCFRRPPLRAPLCASHLKAYHLMRKQVQLCLRRERGAQIFSRALNTLLTHTDKISDPRSRRKPSYSFLTVILQMALSVACEKHLALRDEQSVTYSSRAGSPPRALFAAPEPNPGSQYSSRANSVSSDPTPMDVFSQSGSYHEEPMDERESGMADIPATHLPSIDDLGLPPCCANWAVTGRHGLIMLQCTPEDARHAFEAERASGRFCMATALAELAQAIRRAAPNVPTSGDSFAAFCHSAGPACRALHEHVKAATTCGSRSERRRNRDDATVATALCMLAHAANQNATSGVLEQFGLLLEPTAKRAGILHHYGLTPSPTTMKNDRKEAALRSGHLTNQACFNARLNSIAMGSALDDYHAFDRQLEGPSLHREFRVFVVRPLAGVAAVPHLHDPSYDGGIRPGVFPECNGLNASMRPEQKQVAETVIAELKARLVGQLRLMQARPDFFLGFRTGEKVDLQQLRHRQELIAAADAVIAISDNVYDTAASQHSLADVHLASVAEGPLKSGQHYADACRNTFDETPELKKFL